MDAALTIVALGLLAAAGARVLLTQQVGADDGDVWGGGSGGGAAEPGAAGVDRSDANVAAFLLMIRTAEGTADANGYRALFGHRANRPRLFEGWADHPRIASQFTDKRGRRLWTSAAGAFQFMAVSAIPTGGRTSVDTWDRMARDLKLPDFSPASQDAAAVELIRRRGALGDVRAGRFAAAVEKCAPEWASLPGAGYDQPEKSIDDLSAAYARAGGSFA